MAEKDKRIEFELPEDGSNRGSVFIPPLAMDSTLQDLLKNNQALKTNLDKYLMAVARKMQDSEKTSEALDDLVKTLEKKTEDANKETKDAKESIIDFGESVDGAQESLDEMEESAKQAGSSLREATNKIGRAQVQAGKDMMFVLNAFDFVVKSLVSFGTITGGYLVASVTNTGEALKSLTDVGQAFGDVTGTGTRTTLDNITAFGRLGFTVDQASQIFQTFSRTSAVLGQTRVPDLSKQFLELTNYGQSLGITLDDATQYFLEDVEYRSRILNRDQMRDARHAILSAQSLENLRLFSTALGISTDELRQGSRGMLESNQSIQSLIMNMGQRGPEVQQALNDLVGGLKASGIDDQLIEGILTVASVGATGASEFLAKIAPIGSEAFQAMTNMGLQIRQGSITLDGVNPLLQSILQTFSTLDTQGTIQALLASELGGEMQQSTQAFIESSRNAEIALQNFETIEQRNKRFAQQTGQSADMYDPVQEALIAVQNSFKRVIATTSVFQTSLVSNIEGFSDFMNNQKGVNRVLEYFAQRVGDIGRMFGEAITRFLNRLGGGGPNSVEYGLRKIVDGLSNVGERLAEFFDRVLMGFLDENNNVNIMGGIINYVKSFLQVILPPVIGLIGTAIWEGITALFSEQGATLGLAILGLFASKVVLTAAATGLAGMFMTSRVAMTGAQTIWWTSFSSMMYAQFATLMTRLNIMAMGGAGAGFLGGRIPGKGGGMLGTIGRVATPLAIIGGGMTLIGDGMQMASDDPVEAAKGSRGMIGGLLGGGLMAGLGLALSPFTGGLSLGLTAAGIAAMGGAGYYIGSSIGESTVNEEKIRQQQGQPAGTIAVQDKDGNIQYIQTAQPQQQTSNRIKYHAIEDIANQSAVQGGMSIANVQKINQLSDEAKILTQILIENKVSRKFLKAISEKTFD